MRSAKRGRRWAEGIEAIHGGIISDQIVAGDWLSVASSPAATCRSTGRLPMQEIRAREVRDGKVVHEQFSCNT